MKNKFNETYLLPLTFKYLETIKKKTPHKKNEEIIYFIACEKYGTQFYIREKPVKSVTRLL